MSTYYSHLALKNQPSMTIITLCCYCIGGGGVFKLVVIIPILQNLSMTGGIIVRASHQTIAAKHTSWWMLLCSTNVDYYHAPLSFLSAILEFSE